MSNAARLASFGLSKRERDVTKAILDSFKDIHREEEVKKTTFSPSRLAWSSGACARRNWFLFNGVVEKETISATSMRNMMNGTASHEILQDTILDADRSPFIDAIDIERQLQSEDPPINSFCDIVVHYEGKPVPIEIKTAKSVAYEYRQSSKTAADYHIFQLLIYMWILDSDLGFVMYENKDTYEKLLIPVKMDEENTKRIESAIEWMRLVYKSYENQELPKFFKNRRKNSKICQTCPVREVCEKTGEGVVDIPLLTKYERGMNE